ncbi:hypothetical protein D3C75_493930 [compost metagenome]
MELEDNGVGLPADRDLPGEAFPRKGIGLANIQERLTLLFKEEGVLKVAALERGTLAAITLPLLVSNPFGKGGNPDVESTAGGG